MKRGVWGKTRRPPGRFCRFLASDGTNPGCPHAERDFFGKSCGIVKVDSIVSLGWSMKGGGGRFVQCHIPSIQGLHHASAPHLRCRSLPVLGRFRLRFLLLRFILRHELLQHIFLWWPCLRSHDGELLRSMDGWDGCLRRCLLPAEQPREGTPEGVVPVQPSDAERFVQSPATGILCRL